MKISKIVFIIMVLCFFYSESFPQVHQDWTTRTDSITARDIAVDRTGNVYVTGSIFRGTSGFDISLAKYNAAGDQQ